MFRITPSNTHYKKYQDAVNLRNNGREYDAITLYQDIFSEFERENNEAGLALIAQEVGVCFQITNEVEHALEWYQKAYDYYQRVDDLDGLGNTARDLGLAYLSKKDDQKAIELLKHSETLLQKTEDKNALAVTQDKLGLFYSKQGKSEKAITYFDLALETIKTVPPNLRNYFFEVTMLFDLSRHLVKEEKYTEAEGFLYRGLGILWARGLYDEHLRRAGELCMQLAWVNFYLKAPKEAASFFAKAMLAWENMDSGSTQQVITLSRCEEFITQLQALDPSLAEEIAEAYENIL